LDTALYQQLLKNKNEKAMVISEMTSRLLGKCYICWAKGSSTLPAKTSDHKFFVSCQQPHEEKWVPNATGWWSLKKGFKLMCFEYCYWCGLPQGQYQPSAHPPITQGHQMPCILQDFVAVLCWFVFMDSGVYRQASEVFAGLKPGMTQEEFTVWINQVKDAGSFYNGLELVIWL